MKRVCYEIKTSRADFLCELRNPLKRRIGLRYSNEFCFVTPARLVQSAEVPAECGLIEAGPAMPSQWRPAPWRETPGPTWQLLAAMVRNQRYALQGKLSQQRSAQQRLSFDG